MTRASYGPEWSLEANRRRLQITEGITARLLANQTTADFSWVILLDERDPLAPERIAVASEAIGPSRVIPLLWTPKNAAAAPWDKRGDRTTQAQKVAATAYRFPGWRESTGPRDDQILMTRLDDDDGLAVDALARVQRASLRVSERTALMLPLGIRVWRGHYTLVKHETNAMHTLSVPPGDATTVYDYGHRLVGRGQPVVTVDSKVGWLWSRHRDTISGWKSADQPLTDKVRQMFPVDWDLLS
jgi:hypothetical protein